MKEPVVLERERQRLNMKNYEKRSASESDYTYLVSKPTVIYDSEQEQPTIVYLELDDEHADLVEGLRSISYDTDSRTSGLLARSRIFGFFPRNTIRRDFCGMARLAHESPSVHDRVASYAERVSTYYQQYHPELYAEHQKHVTEVLPDYKIGSSVFTSGIINKNNPMPYHHDGGNFKGVWSNMLVFKREVSGGYLSVPEYDVAFRLRNNSLLMFDGQNLLHGVTPIKRHSPDAHRFSIVFYSLQQMWNCKTPEEEAQRIQQIRTRRERERAARDREKKADAATRP